MPKTIEELEAELQRLEEKHSAELAAKDAIIEERDATIATHQEEQHAIEEKLLRFEKAEFDAAMDEYTNSVWNVMSEESRKKYGFKKPEDYKREEINSVYTITRAFKAAHETKPKEEQHGKPRGTMPPSGDTMSKDPKAAVKFELLK